MEHGTPRSAAPRSRAPTPTGPHARPRVRHPAVVLVEESDPAARLAAHLELGRRAVARSDLELAETHFREASHLDPSDERPRAELRGLRAAARAPRRRRLFAWW